MSESKLFPDQRKLLMINYRSGVRRKRSGYTLRVSKDVRGLDARFQSNCEMVDPPRMNRWRIKISPQGGMWDGGSLVFELRVSEEYPITPPKVRCLSPVWHPNIDLDGAVCLNILRDEWKPMYTFNSIFVGLEFLFQNPESSDPLNEQAAREMDSNTALFETHVREYLRRCMNSDVRM